MRIPHYASQWILGKSQKFWRILGKFWRVLANSGEIQGNSGEFLGNSGGFWGNQTKSFSLVFTCFHSFSQRRNTFPSWGNLIPLISPVATVKTDENSGEKKWKGIRREKWIRFPFHFISPPSRPVSIAKYCMKQLFIICNGKDHQATDTQSLNEFIATITASVSQYEFICF